MVDIAMEAVAEIMVEIITIMETIMQALDQIGGKIKFHIYELDAPPQTTNFFLYLKKDLFFSHETHPQKTHTYTHNNLTYTKTNKNGLVSNYLIDYDKNKNDYD